MDIKNITWDEKTIIEMALRDLIFQNAKQENELQEIIYKIAKRTYEKL